MLVAESTAIRHVFGGPQGTDGSSRRVEIYRRIVGNFSVKGVVLVNHLPDFQVDSEIETRLKNVVG